MTRFYTGTLLFILLTFSVQCAHSPQNYAERGTNLAPRTIAAKSSGDWLEDLSAAGAGDGTEYYREIERRVATNRSQKGSPDARSKDIAARIAKYVAFVMHNYDNLSFPTKKKEQVEKELISRIFESSTQFILCPDLSDYECLEQIPEVPPSQKHRQEDPSLGLGSKKELTADFSKSVEWHFTDQLFVPADQVDRSATLASKLEKEIKSIKSKSNDAIYMAVYGVDDIEDSMKGVYTALLDVIDRGIPVQGVFDHDGISAKIKNDKPLVFSYVKPTGDDLAHWIFSPIEGNRDLKPGAKLTGVDYTNMEFKYDRGTQGLITALAKGAKSDDEAEGRLEWKNVNIMHNKFLIFKKSDKLSVWTGTANVSRTCMGLDRNSNMGVLIKNNEVAQAFLDEFKEMYEFQEETPENTDKNFTGPKGKKNFPYGRFHMAKTPNTHRYFHFKKDKTDMRVYFSPTDDAEHRAIIPMIYAARPGDTLLLSMFGAGGMELTRALYWAAANGVNIEVIADTPTARGVNQFLGKEGESTLFNKNPYNNKDGTMFLANNDEGEGGTWGQNHQKIGLLIRGDGTHEQLILGSQNWSGSGNDVSDENLIALRNSKGLEIGEAFAKNFASLKKHAKIATRNDKPKKPKPGEESE